MNGKVAVITGGSNETGAATAKLFAKNGAHVALADTEDEVGARLAESLGGHYIHCDVSVESEVASAVQLALSWKGMFNPGGSIANLGMEQLYALLSVNTNPSYVE